MVQALQNMTVSEYFTRPHIILSTNCPLFSWMLLNRETYRQVVALGLLDDEPYGSKSASVLGFQLMSNILRRKFIIKEEIMEEVRKRFEVIGKKPVVGFHIRRGDRSSDFKETRHFLYEEDIPRFMSCSVFKTVPKATIFIASDSTVTKYKLRDSYPQRRIVVFNMTAEHTYSAVRKDFGRQRVRNVFIDMMTLAQCDYIVGTYRSSYSTLAAAFQGHVPYYVKHRQKCFVPRSFTY